VRITTSVFALWIASLGWPALTAGASAPSCAPRGAKIKTTTNEVQIYRDRAQDYALFACSRRTSKQYLLDDPLGDIHAFPSVAARGHYVAWAVNVPSDTEITTTVNVADERKFGKEDPAEAVVRNDAAQYTADETSAKVGRVVVSDRGEVAWTTCPATDPSSAIASPKPNCVRPGALDRVFKLTAKTRHPKLLAKGRRIDPRSLRLSGNTLTWTNAGRGQRAPLR
jgi:hypothetical protein